MRRIKETNRISDGCVFSLSDTKLFDSVSGAFVFLKGDSVEIWGNEDSRQCTLHVYPGKLHEPASAFQVNDDDFYMNRFKLKQRKWPWFVSVKLERPIEPHLLEKCQVEINRNYPLSLHFAVPLAVCFYMLKIVADTQSSLKTKGDCVFTVFVCHFSPCRDYYYKLFYP